MQLKSMSIDKLVALKAQVETVLASTRRHTGLSRASSATTPLGALAASPSIRSSTSIRSVRFCSQGCCFSCIRRFCLAMRSRSQSTSGRCAIRGATWCWSRPQARA